MSRMRDICIAEGERTRQRILEALSSQEKSATELCAEVELSMVTIRKHLRILREPGNGLIWIKRWQYAKHGCTQIAFYALGDHPDAPKLKQRPPKAKPKKPAPKKARKVELKPAPAPKSTIVSKLGHKPSNIKPPPAVNDPMLAWLMPRKEQREAA